MQETGEIASISARFGDYHTLFSYLLPQEAWVGDVKKSREIREKQRIYNFFYLLIN